MKRQRYPTFSALGWLARMFASQAWLCLFTLLVLIGATLGLRRAMNDFPSRPQVGPQVPSAPSASRGVQAPAGGAGCGQFAVHFSALASVGDIRLLLRTLDAAIVFGPDETDAFQLRVEPAGQRGVLEALDRSPLVVSAERRPGCDRP